MFMAHKSRTSVGMPIWVISIRIVYGIACHGALAMRCDVAW